MDIKNLSEIIIAIVAVGGLGVSIYTLVITRREKKPQIRSKINYGFLDGEFGVTETMFMLDVGNIGEKQVLVSSIEILLGNGKKLMYPEMEGDRKLPFELQPGHSAHFWIPVEKVKSSLKNRGFRKNIKIRANFRDAVGNNYPSKKKLVEL